MTDSIALASNIAAPVILPSADSNDDGDALAILPLADSNDDGDVKIVLTSKGVKYICLVSQEDRHLVDAKTISLGNNGYAVFQSDSKTTPLHQAILLPSPEDILERRVIDHANRNRLDNRRSNLRWVSRSFNNWNRASQKQPLGMRGVTHRLDRSTQKYQAKMSKWCLGSFDTSLAAAQAYDTAAFALFKELAFEMSNQTLSIEQQKEACLLSFEEVLARAPIARVSDRKPTLTSERMLILPRGISFHSSSRLFVVSESIDKHRKCTYFATFRQALEYKNIRQEKQVQQQKDKARERLSSALRNKLGQLLYPIGGKNTGKFTIVDEETYLTFSFYRVSVNMHLNGYIQGHFPVDPDLGSLKTEKEAGMLHRYVMRDELAEAAEAGDHLWVDHINRCRQDNRADNLRLVTPAENSKNSSHTPAKLEHLLIPFVPLGTTSESALNIPAQVRNTVGKRVSVDVKASASNEKRRRL